jgi:hypothetical protein
MVRRFPSGDAGLSKVGCGSGMSTAGFIGGPGEECGLVGDESSAGTPDSTGFSRDSGEGGSNVLLTRGKKRPYRYIPHRS